eukprot:augustus_masked-scaffold_9-processed-gene-9.44-mRNA-1 protein AED:0.30 eAED:0.30 QI:0/-1/0/1/-1/1/1/0/324
MKYTPLNRHQKNEQKESLIHYLKHDFPNKQMSDKDLEAQFDSERFYAVNWTEVPNLVASRKVHIWGGKAFVPRNLVSSLVISRYKSHLMQHLNVASRNFYQNEYQNHQDVISLRSVLKKLQKAYFDKSESEDILSTSMEKLRLNTITPAMKKGYFPLCMQRCGEKLHSKHHLQYHARVQYRLFLKGNGLDLKSALEYFRKGFNMDSGAFEKKYAYNVRHSYGKEGKRKDYQPLTCGMILNGPSQPTSEQVHGCPFKVLSEEKLRGYVGNDDTILRFAREKHYQLACRALFKKRFTDENDEHLEGVGAHPNSWYKQAVKLNAPKK